MEVRSVIQQIAIEHRRRYGYRRISAELRRRGMLVNHKRVLRIIREDNLLAVWAEGGGAPQTSNSKCANFKLSQQRGSPHHRVPKGVPAYAGDADPLEGRLDLLLQHRSQVERFLSLQSF